MKNSGCVKVGLRDLLGFRGLRGLGFKVWGSLRSSGFTGV